MLRYSFSISHVPGKSLAVADTLSTAPLAHPTLADDEFQRDTASYVSSNLSHIPATERRVAEIKQNQQEDDFHKLLMEYSLNRWPSKHNLSDKVRPYYGVAQEISVVDGLLLRGKRMIFPQSLCGTRNLWRNESTLIIPCISSIPQCPLQSNLSELAA